MIKITGPFRQLLTMDHLPLKGSIRDVQLEVVENAGIVHSEDSILDTGNFKDLCTRYESANPEVQSVTEDLVVLPGLVDAHTHLCWAGSRAADYALRQQGATYLDIAQSGGGIKDTVRKTSSATDEEIFSLLFDRVSHQLKNGVTSMEVKSGYAPDIQGELRLLEIIASVAKQHPATLVPTCLAAHVLPAGFHGTKVEYLELVVRELLPEIQKRGLSKRVDIFVDEGAFGTAEAVNYLKNAKRLGFNLVVHGEQFTPGGVDLAVRFGAVSVDHLEAISPDAIAQLAASEVVAMALPGASLGLGCGFAPARKLLNAGCCLAIASDWNPGSAPMGDLLIQSAILGTFEKLSNAEIFAAITFRAAHALRLTDRGILRKGMHADFIGFNTNDYREILYHQGLMKPVSVWKNGEIT